MLLPKKVKFRKAQRGTNRGIAFRGSTISFGEYALQAIEHGLISSRQIEAARRAITRYIKRGGQVWIRIFPDHPLTSKGTETPMGAGKGTLDHFVFKAKPGNIIFELSGVSTTIAKEALRLASHKLTVKTIFLSKEN